jgi:uncharacterized protein (DUF4415 family)
MKLRSVQETKMVMGKRVIDSADIAPQKRVKVYLDEDVLAWLKKDGNGYQARANRMLREEMLKDVVG